MEHSGQRFALADGQFIDIHNGLRFMKKSPTEAGANYLSGEVPLCRPDQTGITNEPRLEIRKVPPCIRWPSSVTRRIELANSGVLGSTSVLFLRWLSARPSAAVVAISVVPMSRPTENQPADGSKPAHALRVPGIGKLVIGGCRLPVFRLPCNAHPEGLVWLVLIGRESPTLINTAGD